MEKLLDPVLAAQATLPAGSSQVEQIWAGLKALVTANPPGKPTSAARHNAARRQRGCLALAGQAHAAQEQEDTAEWATIVTPHIPALKRQLKQRATQTDPDFPPALVPTLQSAVRAFGIALSQAAAEQLPAGAYQP